MSTSTWASPSLLLSGNRSRRPVPAGKRLASGFVEVTLVACLLAGVVGGMSLRSMRAGTIAADEAMAQWEQDRWYGTLGAQAVSRDGFVRETSSFWNEFLPAMPALSDRDRIMVSLPEGYRCSVLVRGALAGRSAEPHYGPATGCHVAYLFEMRYQRAIERNDGRTIVERRTYESVRFAKIVAPLPMRMEPGSPEVSRLGRIAFPDPGAGITVAPVGPVAEALLGQNAEAIADCPASRAFLEQDLLSGKSVRLTYVDGIGVASLEPLGWTLTKPVAVELFGAAVLPPLLFGPDSRDRRPGASSAPMVCLTGFLDPTQSPNTAYRAHLAIGPAERDGESRGVELMLEEPAPEAGEVDSDAEGPTSGNIRLGHLRYDPEANCVTDASIAWPMNILCRTTSRLLFEQDFPASTRLTVQYHCRVE